MGISFSNRRRNNNHYPHHHPPPPNYYSHEPSYFPPHPPPPPPLPPPQNYDGFTSNPSYSTPPPPPPHPPSINSYSYGPYSSCGYANPSTAARFNHQYSYNHQQPPQYFPGGQPNGWAGGMIGPPRIAGPPQQTPPPYVEHQNAKKVRNDVNVHKETVRLEADEQNPDHHLVSFVFDALFDGSFTVSYFAKEESNCKFVPQFPDFHTPARVPFQKGLGQRFLQPSGTGIDLGFFELDDLSKPSAEDVFPLVISAETCSSNENPSEDVLNESIHMQITLAVLSKTDDNPFKVRVIKQILWIDGVRYELRELFGIEGSGATADSFDDNDSGKECVICMTEPKDTAVLPCRHMCMCGECAKALRVQSNKCPICRQPIEELIEIKISNNDE